MVAHNRLRCYLTGGYLTGAASQLRTGSVNPRLSLPANRC